MNNDQPQSRSLTLKPCPLCGSEAALNTCRTSDREYIRLNGRDTGHGVNCIRCGLNNRGIAIGYASEQEAADAWNRRAPVSETGPSAEQYRQAVEKTFQLRLALQQCVAVTEMWHGKEAFDLYFNHSPEMKLIRDALGKMQDPSDAPSERGGG